ncbi:MAG: HAMP domain-containing sensor histidine kinase [Vulcanimicrobiota bacterium]
MIGALWALWGLSFLLLGGLWWLTLKRGISSTLKDRQVMALEGAPQLRESFEALQRLGEVMLTVSAQEARAGLSEQRALELREQGLPFYRFYYLDSAGRSLMPELPEPPEWLPGMLDLLGREQAVLRPLPPGYQNRSSIPEAPENYLVFAVRAGQDRVVLWMLDWDFVFGSWLTKQLRRQGLEDGLKAELRAWGSEPSLDPSPHAAVELTLYSLFHSDFRWSWEVPTFLAEEPNMLDSLRLTLDNRSAVNEEIQRNIPFLFAGAVLLGGFAIVLWLTSRALRRESEFAQAKSRFVSQVSHELRTPITALEMYSEILADGLVSDKDKITEYYAVLRRESHRLKSLVENLLTVGLVENGRWTPRKQSLDLEKLLQEIVASENREGWDIEVRSSSSDTRLQGDHEAIRSALSNLLHNAIKYSPAKEKVELALSSREGWLEVAVSDRGGGLSGSDYGEIFRPYFRASQAEGSKPGVGLGLSLVKQIVEAHGGKVWGMARQGGGSVFTVQLPKE